MRIIDQFTFRSGEKVAKRSLHFAPSARPVEMTAEEGSISRSSTSFCVGANQEWLFVAASISVRVLVDLTGESTLEVSLEST